MAYNIRKNWITSFTLIITRPIVILPFIIIAFLEFLALELVYFSPRRPLLYIVGPIVRKFYGEVFLHYPGSMVILPRLFNYVQEVIYVFIGALLMSICAGVVKNIRLQLPLKANALIKNAFKRYLSFFVFGIIVIIAIILVRNIDQFIFAKLMGLLAKRLPQILIKLSPFIFTLLLFISNIILQTFLVLTIPILVIKKKSLFKALIESISLGLRNFLNLFILIFLPFSIYLPIALLKTDTAKLINRTFPEISLYIIIAEIILVTFVECFVIVCAAHFLLDKQQAQYPDTLTGTSGHK